MVRPTRANPLTKSQGLPLSGSRKEKDLGASGGILGLSGINLDFRKSKDNLKQMFGGKSSHTPHGQQADAMRSSFQFSQMRKL